MKLITAIIAIAFCTTAFAQQKQGHVRRPEPRGVGMDTVVGQAQLEVEYALNATDVKNQNTYIDLHCLLVGKNGLNKQYSVFLERSDSLYDAYLKAHPNAEGVPSNSFTLGRNGEYWSEYQYTEIFTENVCKPYIHGCRGLWRSTMPTTQNRQVCRNGLSGQKLS